MVLQHGSAGIRKHNTAPASRTRYHPYAVAVLQRFKCVMFAFGEMRFVLRQRMISIRTLYTRVSRGFRINRCSTIATWTRSRNT